MRFRKIIQIALAIPLISSIAFARPNRNYLNRFKDKIDTGGIITSAQKTLAPLQKEENLRSSLNNKLKNILNDIKKRVSLVRDHDLQRMFKTYAEKNMGGIEGPRKAHELGPEFLKLFKQWEGRNYFGLAALDLYFWTSKKFHSNYTQAKYKKPEERIKLLEGMAGKVKQMESEVEIRRKIKPRKLGMHISNFEKYQSKLFSELKDLEKLLKKYNLFMGTAKEIWGKWFAEIKRAKDIITLQDIEKAYISPSHLKSFIQACRAFNLYIKTGDKDFYKKIDNIKSVYSAAYANLPGGKPRDRTLKFLSDILHKLTGFSKKDELFGSAETAYSVRADFLIAIKAGNDHSTTRNALAKVLEKCWSRFKSYKLLYPLIDFKSLKQMHGIATPNEEKLFRAGPKSIISFLLKNKSAIEGAQKKFVHIKDFIMEATGKTMDELREQYGSNFQTELATMQTKWDTFIQNLTVFDLLALQKAWESIEARGYSSKETINMFLGIMRSVHEVDPYLVTPFLTNLVPAYLGGTYSEGDFGKALLYFSSQLSSVSTRLDPTHIHELPYETRIIFSDAFEKFRKELSNVGHTYNYYKGLGGDEGIWQRAGGREGYRNPLYYQMKDSPLFREVMDRRLHSFMGRPFYSLTFDDYSLRVNDPGGASLSSTFNGNALSFHTHLSNLLRSPKDTFKLVIPKDYRIKLLNLMEVNSVTNRIFAYAYSEIGKKQFPSEILSGSGEIASYLRSRDIDGEFKPEYELKGLLNLATEKGKANVNVSYRDFYKYEYALKGSGTNVPGIVPLVGSGNILSYLVNVSGRENEFNQQDINLIKKLSKNDSTTVMFRFNRYQYSTSGGKSRLLGYLYFLQPDGGLHKLALSEDDFVRMMNFKYSETETKNLLASIKGHGDIGIHGFALGFNMRAMSTGTLGNFIRDWKTGKDLARQFAAFAGANLKLGHMLSATFRTTQVKKEDGTHSTPVYSVQITYKKIPKNKEELALVFSGLMGESFGTILWGGKAKVEATKGKTKMGFGAIVGSRTISNALVYNSIVQNTDQMAQKMTVHFAEAYGWNESKAKKWGLFLAGMYMQTKLQQEFGQDEQTKHYGRALFLGWISKHNLALGFEKVPGWINMQQELDRMNQQIALMPWAMDSIVANTARNIENAMKLPDLIRISAGYGFKDKISIKAYLDTYSKFGSFRAIAYITDAFYLQALTSGWYMEGMGNDIIALNLFGGFGIHRARLTDQLLDQEIKSTRKKLKTTKSKSMKQQYLNHIDNLNDQKAKWFRDIKFTMGPTLELNWTKDDLSYKGLGVQALTRIFQDRKHDIIAGVMGTSTINLSNQELKQWQVVFSHKMEENLGNEQKLDAYYILFNYAERKVFVGTREEYDSYRRDIYVKLGYEHRELAVKSRTGTSIAFALKVGAITTENENRGTNATLVSRKTRPTVVGGIKFTKYFPNEFSLSLSGGYGPFSDVFSQQGMELDAYRPYIRYWPIDPKNNFWIHLNAIYRFNGL